MNFREKMSRWMVNRYGFDKVSYSLFVLYIGLVIMNLFAHSLIINGISLLVIAVIFYRMISKNIERRRMENALFEKYSKRVTDFMKLQKRRISEIKTHRFRRCKNCRTVMRLKRKTGTHTVECPRCHHEVTVRIWF